MFIVARRYFVFSSDSACPSSYGISYGVVVAWFGLLLLFSSFLLAVGDRTLLSSSSYASLFSSSGLFSSLFGLLCSSSLDGTLFSSSDSAS